jgi:23S rRNA pseudouridine1911/1915/1917 synthase
MTRTITFTVTAAEEGKAVRDIVKKNLNVSAALYSELKRTEGSVTLNGKTALANMAVKVGDTLQIVIEDRESSENIYPRRGNLDILYEDEDILAVNKPPFLPCHPSKGHVDDSLANIVVGYYEEKGEKFVFRCATRLDRDTSGVVIIAKNRLSHDLITEQMKKGLFNKTYYAVVDGRPVPDSGRIERNIRRIPGIATIKREACDSSDGASAITEYKTVAHSDKRTLLKIKTLTGRTHQIRVHLSYIGHPITGDWLYGRKSEEHPRQLLHCGRVSMMSPITGKQLIMDAPLPTDFGKFRP